jgi:hypothetical protein
MNRKLATLILTLSATLGVTSLKAEEKAVANIPFTFHLGSETMPAGKYRISQPISGDRNLFSLSAVTGPTRFVGAPKQGHANPEDSKLTFACYQGQCSLAKIQLPGSEVSYSLKVSDKRSLGLASMISVRLSH